MLHFLVLPAHLHFPWFSRSTLAVVVFCGCHFVIYSAPRSRSGRGCRRMGSMEADSTDLEDLGWSCDTEAVNEFVRLRAPHLDANEWMASNKFSSPGFAFIAPLA